MPFNPKDVKWAALPPQCVLDEMRTKDIKDYSADVRRWLRIGPASDILTSED